MAATTFETHKPAFTLLAYPIISFLDSLTSKTSGSRGNLLGKNISFLENIQDSYLEVDLKGNFLWFNKSVLHILGYTKQELSSMNYRDVLDSENASQPLVSLPTTVYVPGSKSNV